MMRTQVTTTKKSTTAANETERQIEKHLKFSQPTRHSVINPNPSFLSPLIPDLTPVKLPHFDLVYEENPHNYTYYRNIQLAEQAIEAKANELGWAGAAISDIEQVGQGYVIRYQSVDVYYSAATGAHVVYGDIRAKYNALGAANGVLGLPTTDETSTPDGIGRFNHFQGGSIYWTPSTGPMMVRGAIRDLWAAQGWENSPFGYPIADEHRKVVANPNGGATEYWSVFQNGAIYSKNKKALPAVVAEIAPPDLTNLVRKTFDKALKEADSDLGIEGGVNVLNISDWAFGFWKSQGRTITYEINGFYSNGIPLVADPTFRLELKFLFGLTWENTFTEPINKTLVIYLKHWRISASGVGHGTLSDRLVAEVPKKFPFAVQSIPAEALLIDVLVTAQGGLKFLLEPNVDFPPIGEFRRNIFQTELNNLLES